MLVSGSGKFLTQKQQLNRKRLSAAQVSIGIQLPNAHQVLASTLTVKNAQTAGKLDYYFLQIYFNFLKRHYYKLLFFIIYFYFTLFSGGFGVLGFWGFGGRLRERRIHDLHSDENLFL